jgi:hypothetical protein
MSDPQAPVCLIQPVISTDQPPPTLFPAIPQPTDLQSAIQAINALTQIVRSLANIQPRQTVSGSGTGSRSGFKGSSPNPKSPNPQQPGRFEEQAPSRLVKDVTIHSSEDPSTTLTFKRIDRLVFKDSKTGELWGWNR